jgi:hypothetical protein
MTTVSLPSFTSFRTPNSIKNFFGSAKVGEMWEIKKKKD